MTNEQVDFFASLESVAGGPVINYAMVRLLPESTNLPTGGNCYGLFVVTPASFFFKHFANRNWLASLTAGAGTGSKHNKEFTLLLPREKTELVATTNESGFWKRILKPSEPAFQIRYFGETGNEQLLCATVIHSEKGIDRFFADLRPTKTP